MYINDKILIAKNDEKECSILPKMANRHGIITGATGTGKTTTVRVMAESFSAAGIPVFLADVKGDISAMCEVGTANENITKRVQKLNLTDFEFDKFPVRFWDIYGINGHHIHSNVDSFSATLFSRVLELSEAQEGILNIALKIAKDEDMRVIDFLDLKVLLAYIDEHKDEYIKLYGNITSQSIATIQRKLLEFENSGAEIFFGEPELDLTNLRKYNPQNGYGYINVLDATELSKDYNMYSTFMLWLLNKLYDEMPEVGDSNKPKLVVFIDEAHLLFDEMNSSMLKKITQIVKLIRSKGIGLYFISQSPSDIPEDILSQLGNRIQHNLKAYTPQEMKSVKAAAQSFRTNDKFDTEQAILELSTGEALVSFVNEEGQPEVVERAFILPPQSQMGVIDDITRKNIIDSSEFKNIYDIDINTESANEIIEKIKEEEAIEQKQIEEKEAKEKKELAEKKEKEKKVKTKKTSRTEKAVNTAVNRVASTLGNKIGNQIWKNLFK